MAWPEKLLTSEERRSVASVASFSAIGLLLSLSAALAELGYAYRALAPTLVLSMVLCAGGIASSPRVRPRASTR